MRKSLSCLMGRCDAARRRHGARRRRAIVGLPRPAVSRGVAGRSSRRHGRRRTADSTSTCGAPSSTATAWSAPSRSPATTAAISGPAAASSRRRRRTPRTRSACPAWRSRPRTSTPRRSRAAACSACRRATRWTPASPTAATRRTTVSANDPMVGGRIGGVNVFGGGLALYNSNGKIVGGLGVSGDSSCADHNIAWRTRHNLNLDFVPGGVEPGFGPPRQHRLRHHAAGGPDARRQRERMGPRQLQRSRHGDCGWSATGQMKAA